MLTLILMVILLWMKLGAGWALGYLGCFIVDFCILFTINIVSKMLKR